MWFWAMVLGIIVVIGAGAVLVELLLPGNKGWPV